jgi:hypothetical protein
MLFIVAHILFLILRIWAWWSDTPFIMGDVEDNFILLLPTNILPMAVLSYFELLLQNILCVTDYIQLITWLLVFLFQVLSMRQCVFIFPKIKSSSLNLYRHFKASSKLLINWLKSPVGILYKLNIMNLDDLESRSMVQNYKSFSLGM